MSTRGNRHHDSQWQTTVSFQNFRPNSLCKSATRFQTTSEQVMLVSGTVPDNAERPHRGPPPGRRPCRRDILIRGTPYVCSVAPRYADAPLAVLSFPFFSSTEPCALQQKIIHIWLGGLTVSLTDFEMSRTLSGGTQPRPLVVLRTVGSRLPPPASVPPNPNLSQSHPLWAPLGRPISNHSFL